MPMTRCPGCQAQLEVPSVVPGGLVACPYCGHENPIPRSEADIRELDFQAYLEDAGRGEHVVPGDARDLLDGVGVEGRQLLAQAQLLLAQLETAAGDHFVDE